MPESDKPRLGIIVPVDPPILGHSEVEFTRHALDRTKQRGVSQADVLRALRVNRQVVGKQQPGKIRVSWQKAPGLAIHVVYEKSSKHLGIITVIPIGGA